MSAAFAFGTCRFCGQTLSLDTDYGTQEAPTPRLPSCVIASTRKKSERYKRKYATQGIESGKSSAAKPSGSASSQSTRRKSST